MEKSSVLSARCALILLLSVNFLACMHFDEEKLETKQKRVEPTEQKVPILMPDLVVEKPKAEKEQDIKERYIVESYTGLEVNADPALVKFLGNAEKDVQTRIIFSGYHTGKLVRFVFRNQSKQRLTFVLSLRIINDLKGYHRSGSRRYYVEPGSVVSLSFGANGSWQVRIKP